MTVEIELLTNTVISIVIIKPSNLTWRISLIFYVGYYMVFPVFLFAFYNISPFLHLTLWIFWVLSARIKDRITGN